jgi:hypothetical protein
MLCSTKEPAILWRSFGGLGRCGWPRPSRLALWRHSRAGARQAQRRINGRYVVTDRRASGELTLVPDTSWDAILERSGGREVTPEESAEFWHEHEPHMLPRPMTSRRPLSRPGRRGFPAYFDQTAWEEDLARSTPTGLQAAGGRPSGL